MPESNSLEIPLEPLLDVDSQRLRNAIAANCLAIKVECHQAGQKRQATDLKITIEDEDLADADLEPASWRLVPESIRRRTARVIGQARRCPSRFGVPFVGGAYLVPVVDRNGVRRDDSESANPSAAHRMLDEINGYASQLRDVVESVRPEWSDWIESGCRKKLGAKGYEQIKKHLVDADTFARQHSILPTLFPVGGYPPEQEVKTKFLELCNGMASKPEVAPYLSQLADLAARASIVAAQRADPASAVAWAESARQATSEELAKSVQNMIHEPLAEFEKALRGFDETLSKGGTVGEKSFNPVRRALEKLYGFAFMLPGELLRRMDAVRDRINIPAKTVSGELNSSIASELAKYIRGVADEVSAAPARQSVLEGFMRKLEV